MANYHPEKSKVARSFAAAAQRYDDVAILQRQTADELLERLSFTLISPQNILDLGTGTGRNLSLLQKKFPHSTLFAMDLASDMLTQAKQRFKHDMGIKKWWPKQKKLHSFSGDAELIPLQDNSVDFVFANLSLQWCRPELSFREIYRVMKPEGLLVFSSLGPDTLCELRQAWAEVDDYPHVNQFFDMHDLGEVMTSVGLQDCVLDVETVTLTYQTPMAMMKDLKILGAHNVNSGRRRGLTGKATMQKVIQAYEQLRVDDKIPASYEVIYGHAWKGKTQQQCQPDGSVHIDISQIGRS